MSKIFLNETEIRKIHETSIKILEKIGIKLLHERLLKHISDFNEIKIDWKNKIVKFTPQVIEESLKKAGKKFKVYGRNKNKSADFGYDKVITSSSWGMPFKIDVINNKKTFAGIPPITHTPGMAFLNSEILIFPVGGGDTDSIQSATTSMIGCVKFFRCPHAWTTAILPEFLIILQYSFKTGFKYSLKKFGE